MTVSIQSKAGGTQGSLQINGADSMVFDSTGAISGINRSAVTQMPTQGSVLATTSGTAVDFTGIPNWVKRITLMFNGVSTSGISPVVVRLGTLAGGIEATAYGSSSGLVYGANSTTMISSTTDFLINLGSAASVRNGALTLTNFSSSSNVWVLTGAITDVSIGVFNSGAKTLSGVLDRIRITTSNGTDVFDAGSVNIYYE